MTFLVYMHDIAFMSPQANTTQRVLFQMSRLSATLSFRVNNTKTETYKWNPSPPCETILLDAVPHKVCTPIVMY